MPRARPMTSSPARFLAAAIAIVAASRCAQYRARPVSAETNAEVLAARTLDSPAVRELITRQMPEVTWPPERWTPPMLALAAVALHPDLDVARAEWDAARAALRTASERPNPNANAGLEHQATGGNGNPWIVTLSLDVPIETAGKRGARAAQARALSAAAAADVDQEIWKVRVRAERAALDLGASRKLAALREAETALRAEIVQMWERRVAAGEAAQAEAVRVRADERASRLLLREEQGRGAEREAALASSIGIPRAALPPLDLTVAATRTSSDAGRLRAVALTARPDVLAALARYDAAEQALRLEVRRQYPDVHVGPGLGWDQGAFRWALSATAELPLFNRHEGPIAEAEARRAAEAARLLAVQSRILGELEAALANADAARARLDETERAVTSAGALVAATRRQFAAGEIDRLALRNVELLLTLAEVDRWSAWFDVQRAAVAVEAAVEQPS
ncbi:MAG TPA: TolC family protein [Thermoanaerobaculia bacterium]|nr:TolC family protein [Thermoanaerobaculia bacterium]